MQPIRSLCLLFLLLGIGCSLSRQNQNPLLDSLENRGLIPLSPENPYLAANLLLTKEMEQSAELKGFIEHQGAPPALEVGDSFFGSRTLSLYYPDKEQFFALALNSGTWVISGPFSLNREQMKALRNLARAAETGREQTQPKPPVGLTNQDKAYVDSTLETINKILVKVKGPQAELNSRGDLIHTVKQDGETLELVVIWYTFERENTDRVGRINKLEGVSLLSLGQQVVIPGYLIKNKIQLPLEAVSALDSVKPAANSPLQVRP